MPLTAHAVIMDKFIQQVHELGALHLQMGLAQGDVRISVAPAFGESLANYVNGMAISKRNVGRGKRRNWVRIGCVHVSWKQCTK